jgi:hypothetical protein
MLWPLPDNACKHIYARHVIEHVSTVSGIFKKLAQQDRPVIGEPERFGMVGKTLCVYLQGKQFHHPATDYQVTSG